MRWKIADHGMIGNMHTAALVATDGSIDFLCVPRFDSPSVFAGLLDEKLAGYFRVAPDLDGARLRQRYMPDTNVLQTRFLAHDGLAEVTDFMPVSRDGRAGDGLVRTVKTVRGSLAYVMECKPRFDYARTKHRVEPIAGGLVFIPEREGLGLLRLRSNLPLEVKDGDAFCEFRLNSAERAWFVLEWSPDAGIERLATNEGVDQAQDETLTFWRNWMSRCTYDGRWRETVLRSVLTLKMMMSDAHGSMVAAPTFGLPGGHGNSVRNWDYRYTWVRDTSFAVASLHRLGFHGEAEAFFRWIEQRVHEFGDVRMPLQPLYRVDGGTDVEEWVLEDFAGYAGARPVRIGNAAALQLQLDTYGELLQALDLSDEHEHRIYESLWTRISWIVDWVVANWTRADDGIWESRGGAVPFLHSRVMCWVTLHHALRIARRRSLPAPVPVWREARDAIYRDVMKNFWNPQESAFVQHLGARTLDASALLLPIVGFCAPTDPRWLSTLRAIERRLVEDTFVFRYECGEFDDGLAGEDAIFTTCTFWYVEALARAGEMQRARFVLEAALGNANHLGLFGEQLGMTGEHLGNFPQGLTHLALIDAAMALDWRLSRSE